MILEKKYCCEIKCVLLLCDFLSHQCRFLRLDVNESRKISITSFVNQTSILSIRKKSLLLICLVLNEWTVLITVTLHKGKAFLGFVRCPNDHYQCDMCPKSFSVRVIMTIRLLTIALI